MKKILVIDDNDDFRNSVQDVLEIAGLNTIQAGNGIIGLSLAQQIIPNLIICDIHMPGMDGYEFLDRLRQGQSTANIPFVFLSGSLPVGDRSSVSQANACLAKPFKACDLLAVVKNQLQLTLSVHQA